MSVKGKIKAARVALKIKYARELHYISLSYRVLRLVFILSLIVGVLVLPSTRMYKELQTAYNYREYLSREIGQLTDERERNGEVGVVRLIEAKAEAKKALE